LGRAFLLLLVLAWPYFPALAEAKMTSLERSGITVEFPAGSEAAAERVLQNALSARRTFAPLFPTVPNLQLHIQWFPEAIWKQRGHGPWGMPTALGKDGVLLPATDIEMPEACVVIIDPLTQLDVLTRDEVRELKALAPTTHRRTRAELEAWLKSREFYHALMTDFVLPHEIFHVYCNNIGLRRQPVWPYESLAQWSAEYCLRHNGQAGLARFYHLCYRMYYLAGRGKDGNDGLIKFTNYAWFHGADTVMLGELAERLGEDFIPHFVAQAQKSPLDKMQDADWVALLSKMAGEDLTGWFGEEWGVR
jgi:hypothetical protein